MSTTTTNHDNDEESEEEQPKPQPDRSGPPKPRLSDKERTLARLKQLKAEGLVFKSYDGISEPEYTVFDTRGGLKQRGTFGRS